MLVGYMRVSSDSDRQTTDLQRDALLSAGVDSRHLFEDHASGAKDDRCGLAHGGLAGGGVCGETQPGEGQLCAAGVLASVLGRRRAPIFC